MSSFGEQDAVKSLGEGLDMNCGTVACIHFSEHLVGTVRRFNHTDMLVHPFESMCFDVEQIHRRSEVWRHDIFIHSVSAFLL